MELIGHIENLSQFHVFFLLLCLYICVSLRQGAPALFLQLGCVYSSFETEVVGRFSWEDSLTRPLAMSYLPSGHR